MTEPRKEELLIGAGNDLYSQGQFEEAIEKFDQAGNDPAALKSKANALLLLSRTEEAIACYDQIVALAPKDASALTDKALLLDTLGRYRDAIALYDQALKLTPDAARIHRFRALALRLAGDYEDSLIAYERALELDNLDSDTWAGKADLLIELGRREEALDCLERASTAPNGRFGPLDWRTRGDSWALAGDHDAAIHCFERAIGGNPQDALAFRGKARSLLAKESVDLVGALACLDRAIEIDPNNYKVYFEKANALVTNGQPREALEFYEAALDRNATDKYSWVNRGYCLEVLGELTPALDAYSKAIESDPEYTMAWEGRGRCLDRLGQPRESARAYRRALALDPELLWANNNLGWLLTSHLDQPETALAYLDKAIEIDPEEALPYNNKAMALAELDRATEAKELLEDVVDRVREPASVLRSLGAIYFDFLNQPDRALERLEEAERTGANDSITSLCMSEILICSGRQEEARQRILDWENLESDTINDPRLLCVASFLRFASHAIGDGLDEARPYFQTFVDRMQKCQSQDSDEPPIPRSSWRYDGFSAAIAQRPIDLLTLVTLLISVDFQRGQLAAPSLAQPGLEVPLAVQALPKGKRKSHSSLLGNLIDIVTGWIHDKLDKD